MNKTSVFKSVEGCDKIRGYYNNILKLFPITKRFVNTSFGQTFVLEVGNIENPSVVLLHGSCSNSASWLGDLPALTTAYQRICCRYSR